MANRKNNHIIQAWLVLLLTIIFGSSLAGVQLILAPKIMANKRNETLEKVPQLLPDPAGLNRKEGIPPVDIQSRTIDVVKNGRKKSYRVFQGSTEGQTAGWVVKSSGQGYADKIEVLIGLDPQARTISGLFILDQKETPGLGSKIIEPAWRRQFENKNASVDLVAVKKKASSPNEIDAITGATISSRSVCDIINSTVRDLRPVLPQKGTETRTGKP